MNIKIKSFMELDNVSLSTPAKISGENGIGKTTIFRAFCFAMGMNDPQTNKTFDGSIYRQKNSQITESYKVSVELDFGSVILRREAQPKIKFDGKTTEVTRSVTSKYFKNDIPINQTNYFTEINARAAGITPDALVNYKYLRTLTIAESKKLFSEIFDLHEFDNNPLDLAKLRKNKIYTEINQKKSVLTDSEKRLSELNIVENVNDALFVQKSRLAVLQGKRQHQMPILTAEQIDENKKISSKISEIEKMEFSPMPLKEVRELISTSHINKSITSIKEKIKEIEVSVFEFEDTKIGKIKENLKKIEAFKAELEKPEAFEGLHCPTCGTPRSGLSHSEIQNSITILDEDKLTAELGKMELEKQSLMAVFNNEKLQKIAELKVQMEDLKSKVAEIELENDEANKYNLAIFDENRQISLENIELEKMFNAKKEDDILGLKKGLQKPADFDFSEIDSQMEVVAEKIKELEVLQKEFIKYEAKKNLLEDMVSSTTILIDKLKKELFEAEQKYALEKNLKVSFYEDAEKDLNAQLPEGVSVKLFKKNISNDDISDTFEISYNNSHYNSGGYEILNITRLIKAFQNKLGVDLPIFIDEFANVVNEDIIKKLPDNVVLIVPEKNAKLTIK